MLKRKAENIVHEIKSFAVVKQDLTSKTWLVQLRKFRSHLERASSKETKRIKNGHSVILPYFIHVNLIYCLIHCLIPY